MPEIPEPITAMRIAWDVSLPPVIRLNGYSARIPERMHRPTKYQEQAALESLAGALAYRSRYRLQIPNQPEVRHQLQQVEGDVEFPPVESLAHRGRIVMVVVMPSLAQRDDREPHVVAAGIPGLVALAPENVRQRIDGVGSVIDSNGGNEESPHQHLPSVGAQAGRRALEQHSQQKDADPENGRHGDIETVQEAQLGVLEQILHPGKVRGKVFMRHEPPHVAPKESVLHRRMHVIRLIRVDMVVAMVCRPPNGPALHGRGAQQSEDELPDARSLEGAVRKIAMLEARDGEHPKEIEHHRDGQRHPAETHPDYRKAGGMHQKERQHPRPIDVPAGVAMHGGFAGPRGKVAVSEPTRQFPAHPFRGGRLYHDLIFWSHTIPDCSAAMRSSSGGWLMNRRVKPLVPPVLIPNACICGGIGSPWLCFNTCRAPIILPVPARSAPP